MSERNLNMIFAIGMMRYLSSHQLWQEFYPKATYETATQRLTQLYRYGFISREFAYPKAVTNPGVRPTAIYFFSSKNKQNLRAYLTAHGKADRCDVFDALPTTDKDDKDSFSNAHLVHETSIAAFFLQLIKACANNPEWELLMWEITSPRSADIPDKDLIVNLRQRKKDGSVEPKTTHRHFNPDGVALIREPQNTYTFNILKTDNNSNNPEDIRAKFEAFIAYDRQGKFVKLIEMYARKYYLDIPSPDDIGVRYLFVASNYSNDHRRRNQLFLEANPYGRTKQFLFTSLTDCTADNILTGNIWMRGREYRDVAKPHIDQTLHPDTTPLVRLRKQHEILNNSQHMPLVSLAVD